MSNGLSQAEIDALLRGDAPAEESSEAQPDAPSSDTPTAAEQAAQPETAAEAPAPEEAAPDSPAPSDQSQPEQQDEEVAAKTETTLNPMEIDAMGEIGNISMGTSATTLNTLLGKKVSITTPRVEVTTIQEVARKYPLPFVAVEVLYTQGIQGRNILFMMDIDVKIIADLLMGGDGSNTEGEINELHLSAISEVMNQMVGSSSTSLSQILGTPIDISPPNSYAINLADADAEPLAALGNDEIVCTRFHMEVEGLINSEIMQIVPIGFAQAMVGKMLGDMEDDSPADAPASQPAAAPAQAPAAAVAPAPQAQPAPPAVPVQQPMAAPAISAAGSPVQPQQTVNVQPATFQSFDTSGAGAGVGLDNIDLLMDVPLQVSVELGKSQKYIKEILEFNVGTIIVLDKLAGELVDVVVNGKLIAKGEVVVIDDSYGARITDVISPAKRIETTK